MNIKQFVSTLFAVGITLGTTTSHADGLKFLPGLQADFKAEPSIALSAGVTVTSASSSDSLFIYGLDLNMNCGLIQTPENRIRTHVQINHVGESGMKSTSFEISPRYTVPVGSGFSVGAGPVVALVKADFGYFDKDLFGYGAVLGANYRQGIYYSGLDLRYLKLSEVNSVSLENWAVLAKVGINF